MGDGKRWRVGAPPKQGQGREVKGKVYDGTDWDSLGRKETLLAQNTHSAFHLQTWGVLCTLSFLSHPFVFFLSKQCSIIEDANLVSLLP